MQPHCATISVVDLEVEEEGYAPAVVVVAVDMQDLLALDTQHTVG